MTNEIVSSSYEWYKGNRYENKLKTYITFGTQLVRAYCRQFRVAASTLTSELIRGIEKVAVLSTCSGNIGLVDEWTTQEVGYKDGCMLQLSHNDIKSNFSNVYLHVQDCECGKYLF